MNGLSDSIAWPSRDPQWVTKILLMGLVNLVPIVGQMALLGWMLTALDSLRAAGGMPASAATSWPGAPAETRRAELPPAGFSYIGRGVNLFVVYFLYGLAFVVVFSVLFGVGIAVAVARDGALAPLGVLLIVAGYAVLVLGLIGLYLASPVIIAATERGGIGGGINLPDVVSDIVANPSVAFYSGLYALVSYLIGGAGSIACLVGQIFTVPYGYAVLAGVVLYYEQHAGPVAGPRPTA